MTAYPDSLQVRWASTLRDLLHRVRNLEVRTAGIDSGMPLGILPGVVDSGYTSGNPKVNVNGSGTLSGPYDYLASYTPAAGDAVIVAPIPVTGQSGGAVTAYIVLGKIA